jgi:CMP-N,N'-diacetyllegionaminic acid synthase
MGQRTLGIVPARAGSKGIVRKNLRLLAGKPLLAYTAGAALQSQFLTKVVLSSEDREILETGRLEGLDTPFVRPMELAADDTPMLDVVLHCVRWFQSRGEEYDAVCLLQPTSPLRSAGTIDRCISRLFDRDVESVVSIRPVPSEYNPHWVYFENPDGSLTLSTGEIDPIPSRQQLPRAYHRDGSVFVVKTKTLLERRSLYGARTVGVVSPEAEACDLDTEEQWGALERRMALLQAANVAGEISRR